VRHAQLEEHLKGEEQTFNLDKILHSFQVLDDHLQVQQGFPKVLDAVAHGGDVEEQDAVQV